MPEWEGPEGGVTVILLSSRAPKHGNHANEGLWVDVGSVNRGWNPFLVVSSWVCPACPLSLGSHSPPSFVLRRTHLRHHLLWEVSPDSPLHIGFRYLVSHVSPPPPAPTHSLAPFAPCLGHLLSLLFISFQGSLISPPPRSPP